MTHPDYWNSVPYSAELDSAAKVPTAASTGKQGFGAAILDSELQRNQKRSPEENSATRDDPLSSENSEF